VARLRLTPDLESIVEFTDVGVRLPRMQRRRGQGRKKIRRIAGEVSRDEVWVLRNASFSVRPGEALALVGYPGSGRDQALRLAAGTLMPDEGVVRRRVPIVPIIGLGGALSRSATVRQNIYLLGGLLGMLPSEMAERLPAIVERAGVQKILDKFMGEASRSVRGRLVWTVAMSTDAAAYAISGGLVVGQPSFQRECWDLIEERKAAGITFMVVSDKPSELLRFCDRALLLDGGTVVAQTTVEDALERLKDIKPPKDHVHFVPEEDDDSDDEDLV
jgi:ABC-2 type transport system ATP-binding protein